MQGHSLGGGIITGGSSFVGVAIHSKDSAFVRTDVGGEKEEKEISSKKDQSKISQRNQQACGHELLKRCTVGLLEMMKKCNKDFNFDEEKVPKRLLTFPGEGVLNNNYDNEHSDYILRVRDVITNTTKNTNYMIEDILGKGTFGQVVRCSVGQQQFAVKVIKNRQAYFQQAKTEILLLRVLNKCENQGNTNIGQEEQQQQQHEQRVVQLIDFFVFRNHFCLVFELLDQSLFDFLKGTSFTGFPLPLIAKWTKAIVHGMIVAESKQIIHCDLKPENIMLKDNEVKIIDFGSACHQENRIYTYIQSRFYRAPEVILGMKYTIAIDMWSLGCIIAELFLGIPLFPGNSEYDQLSRIISIRGSPSKETIQEGRFWQKFFSDKDPSLVALKTRQEFELAEKVILEDSKRYYPLTCLSDLKKYYNNSPFRQIYKDQDERKVTQQMEMLLDLLDKLLQIDPRNRISASGALKHPFLSEEMMQAAETLPEIQELLKMKFCSTNNQQQEQHHQQQQQQLQEQQKQISDNSAIIPKASGTKTDQISQKQQQQAERGVPAQQAQMEKIKEISAFEGESKPEQSKKIIEAQLAQQHSKEDSSQQQWSQTSQQDGQQNLLQQQQPFLPVTFNAQQSQLPFSQLQQQVQQQQQQQQWHYDQHQFLQQQQYQQQQLQQQPFQPYQSSSSSSFSSSFQQEYPNAFLNPQFYQVNPSLMQQQFDLNSTQGLALLKQQQQQQYFQQYQQYYQFMLQQQQQQQQQQQHFLTGQQASWGYQPNSMGQLVSKEGNLNRNGFLNNQIFNPPPGLSSFPEQSQQINYSSQQYQQQQQAYSNWPQQQSQQQQNSQLGMIQLKSQQSNELNYQGQKLKSEPINNNNSQIASEMDGNKKTWNPQSSQSSAFIPLSYQNENNLTSAIAPKREQPILQQSQQSAVFSNFQDTPKVERGISAFLKELENPSNSTQSQLHGEEGQEVDNYQSSNYPQDDSEDDDIYLTNKQTTFNAFNSTLFGFPQQPIFQVHSPSNSVFTSNNNPVNDTVPVVGNQSSTSINPTINESVNVSSQNSTNTRKQRKNKKHNKNQHAQDEEQTLFKQISNGNQYQQKQHISNQKQIQQQNQFLGQQSQGVISSGSSSSTQKSQCNQYYYTKNNQDLCQKQLKNTSSSITQQVKISQNQPKYIPKTMISHASHSNTTEEITRNANDNNNYYQRNISSQFNENTGNSSSSNSSSLSRSKVSIASESQIKDTQSSTNTKFQQKNSNSSKQQNEEEEEKHIYYSNPTTATTLPFAHRQDNKKNQGNHVKIGSQSSQQMKDSQIQEVTNNKWSNKINNNSSLIQDNRKDTDSNGDHDNNNNNNNKRLIPEKKSKKNLKYRWVESGGVSQPIKEGDRQPGDYARQNNSKDQQGGMLPSGITHIS